jgi:hypothetical protein
MDNFQPISLTLLSPGFSGNIKVPGHRTGLYLKPINAA